MSPVFSSPYDPPTHCDVVQPPARPPPSAAVLTGQAHSSSQPNARVDFLVRRSSAPATLPDRQPRSRHPTDLPTNSRHLRVRQSAPRLRQLNGASAGQPAQPSAFGRASAAPSNSGRFQAARKVAPRSLLPTATHRHSQIRLVELMCISSTNRCESASRRRGPTHSDPDPTRLRGPPAANPSCSSAGTCKRAWAQGHAQRHGASAGCCNRNSVCR